MKKINYKSIAKNVIDLEIAALKKLKGSLNKSFDQAVDAIVKCQSKVILCGVGKSYLIASKISATLSSVGCPSFSLSANECSHGDLGSISKKDVLILFSNSGETQELKPVIEYANRNRITLIGIVSKKNSLLFKASDIKLFIPEVKEAGLGIVPTSSTCEQLAIGDCLAVAALNKKGFSKKNFKVLHPKGSLGAQLKTVEDLMIKGNKIPILFVIITPILFFSFVFDFQKTSECNLFTSILVNRLVTFLLQIRSNLLFCMTSIKTATYKIHFLFATLKGVSLCLPFLHSITSL